MYFQNLTKEWKDEILYLTGRLEDMPKEIQKQGKEMLQSIEANCTPFISTHFQEGDEFYQKYCAPLDEALQQMRAISLRDNRELLLQQLEAVATNLENAYYLIVQEKNRLVRERVEPLEPFHWMIDTLLNYYHEYLTPVRGNEYDARATTYLCATDDRLTTQARDETLKAYLECGGREWPLLVAIQFLTETIERTHDECATEIRT